MALGAPPRSPSPRPHTDGHVRCQFDPIGTVGNGNLFYGRLFVFAYREGVLFCCCTERVLVVLESRFDVVLILALFGERDFSRSISQADSLHRARGTREMDNVLF